MTTVYQPINVYWVGESLEFSEPAYDGGVEFPTRAEAEQFARSRIGRPTPGLTPYEEHFEIVEVEITLNEDGVPWPEDVRRWIYEGDACVEEVACR